MFNKSFLKIAVASIIAASCFVGVAEADNPDTHIYKRGANECWVRCWMRGNHVDIPLPGMHNDEWCRGRCCVNKNINIKEKCLNEGFGITKRGYSDFKDGQWAYHYNIDLITFKESGNPRY